MTVATMVVVMTAVAAVASTHDIQKSGSIASALFLHVLLLSTLTIFIFDRNLAGVFLRKLTAYGHRNGVASSAASF